MIVVSQLNSEGSQIKYGWYCLLQLQFVDQEALKETVIADEKKDEEKETEEEEEELGESFI